MDITARQIQMDKYYRIPVAMTLTEYMLDKHNTTNIELPPKREGAITGVTITTVPVLFKDDDAREYIAKTLNNQMGGFIPHYYIGFRADWKILDDSYCWQKQSQNCSPRDTICIAVTINDGVGTPMMFNMTPFQHAAQLTAYILYKNKLKPGSVKVTKSCAEFITSRWKEFKWIVNNRFTKLGGKL